MRKPNRTARHEAPRRAFFQRAVSANGRFVAITAFLCFTFLLGGGSRADISSLIILRPLAAGFAAYAVLQLTREQLALIRFPLVFIGLCAVVIAAQLIPLPPELWTRLPARDLHASAFAAGGMVLPWQPLAMSPGRAFNALMALLVPLAGLLLFALQAPEKRGPIFTVCWALALTSVVVGLFQLAGSPNGPLYWYRITNNGLPVGLFSNRNHQALMTAIGIFLSAVLLVRELRRSPSSLPRMVGAGGAVFVLAPFLLIAGSRGGLLLGMAMLFVGALYTYAVWRTSYGRHGTSKPRGRRDAIVVAAGATALVAVLGAMAWFSRSLALDRLLGKNVEFDLRFQILPTIIELTKSQFPWGSGFGSFEFIYKQFEPTDLLMPSYVNQAHNDWLQILLEGGLPAAVLLIAFVAWIGQCAFMLWRQRRARNSTHDVAALVIILAIGVFSFFDYPLRTPSLMALFAICTGQLAAMRRKRQVASP